MPHWFRRVALLAIAVVALPSAIITGVGTSGMVFPPRTPVILYLTPMQIVPDQAIHAPKDAIRALFSEFSGAVPFAAFAADGDGHRAFTSGRHSPAAARAQALARCGKGCVVMFEHRPSLYHVDETVQTVSQDAAPGIALAIKGKPQSQAIHYALADDGSWSVQTPADGGFLPQWAVLNRCRAMLADNDRFWPDSLPPPRCHLFHGLVGVIMPVEGQDFPTQAQSP